MIKSKTYFIFSLLFLLSITTLYSQEESKEYILNKNEVFINVTPLFLAFGVSANYMRTISQKQKSAYFVKIGAAYEWFYGSNNGFVFSEFGILTGRKKHRFEASLGPLLRFKFYPSSSTEHTIGPSFHIGGRIQKAGRKYVFRYGAGYPEILYIGFGANF